MNREVLSCHAPLRTRVNQTRSWLVFCMTLLTLSGGCGCGRRDGLAELRRIDSALRDIEIVESAGVTKEQFSNRLADALLKIGDLEQSSVRTVPKFSKSDQQRVTEVYQHFLTATEAYKTAKDYFGEKYEFEVWVDTVRMDEYNQVKQRFPNLPELEVVERDSRNPDYVFYSRRDMLHALWDLAASKREKARALIEKL